jgi:hypothetical protein
MKRRQRSWGLTPPTRMRFSGLPSRRSQLNQVGGIRATSVVIANR